jgi:hypothetical protein
MKIGVFLTKKKKDKLRWEQLVNIIGYFNFISCPFFLVLTCYSEHKLIEINPETIEEQGPYDVMLLRLTENLSVNDLNTVKLISDYISKHPEIRIIDPLEGQGKMKRKQ